MESPEAWFEDFGEAGLTSGTAYIQLPSDFAQVADMSHYQVFLTPYDSAASLGVFERSEAGFSVRSLDGSSPAFGYRLLAKRRDIPAPRLETFVPPPTRIIELNNEPPTP